LEKKIEGIIFKQTTTEKKNLNIQYDLLTKSENYEVYKEKADNIFASNEIKKRDIIKGQKLYKKSKKLKRSRELIKERLIIEELQLQLADRAGVKISDAELNSTFSRLASNNQMSLEEFISFIETNGDSYEEVRETMRKEMRIQRIQRGRVNSNIEITEKEFEAFESEDTLSILNRYVEESEIDLQKSTIQDIIKEVYQEACEVI